MIARENEANIYNETFSAINMKEIMTFSQKQMKLEIIM